jgi:predicted transcriptional regulator
LLLQLRFYEESMSDVVSLLQELGFGDYTARAYTALLQRSPLSGYELARESGVPRANIYAVLQKLEERGAVVRLDTPAGLRYAPVPPDQITQQLGRRFQETLSAAQHALAELAAPTEYAYISNTRGYAVQLEHARALISTTHTHLLIGVQPQEAQALAGQLAEAQTRGVEVTTLCMQGCLHECGGCRGHIHRYHLAPEQPQRWLVLVSDDAEMLAGEIAPGDDALTVRTRQQLLVQLTSWYIRHSIALASLVDELGDRLDQLLGPEVQATLRSLGPDQQRGGWLAHMRRLLGQRGIQGS